jgi:hypothetical protein
VKVECTLHCHGRNDGVQCTNNGFSAAPSGTFNLKQKTTSPRPSHNQKRLRANTQGEATAQTCCISFDDVNKRAEENDESDLTELHIEQGQGLEEEEEEEEEYDVQEEENYESDLTELDIEEGEGLDEYKDVDEEEEEEEDAIEEEGN